MQSLTDRTRQGMSSVLAGERGGWRSRLLFAGPAIIASVAYMDPGNYATNIQAGAGYGYTLLWVVLLANLIAMLFQGLSGRRLRRGTTELEILRQIAQESEGVESARPLDGPDALVALGGVLGPQGVVVDRGGVDGGHGAGAPCGSRDGAVLRGNRRLT